MEERKGKAKKGREGKGRESKRKEAVMLAVAPAIACPRLSNNSHGEWENKTPGIWAKRVKEGARFLTFHSVSAVLVPGSGSKRRRWPRRVLNCSNIYCFSRP